MTIFTHSRWDALLNTTITEIMKLSELKGGEYSGDDDRLANFRRNALALGLPMEAIWAVYAAKHWDALMQYVKDMNSGKTRERLEPLAGRVDDLIVYLLLFKAMLEEHYGQEGCAMAWPGKTTGSLGAAIAQAIAQDPHTLP